MDELKGHGKATLVPLWRPQFRLSQWLWFFSVFGAFLSTLSFGWHVLVFVLGVAAYFLPGIPLAQQYLGLDWLEQPGDYGVVGLAVAGWAVVLGLEWWLLPPAEGPVTEPVQEYEARPSYV